MATKLIVGVNDLASQNPSLAAEWDYEKNGDFRPEMFTTGSSRKMYWVGKCGHHWDATIASRNKGVGCPVCARKNNAVKIRMAAVMKHGSLKDSNPELLPEWDYTKNVDFKPDEVASQSHELVWWVCSICGNEWQAIIRNRVKGSSCPECIMAKKKPIKPKKVFVSLADSNPQVALEWHPTRNGKLLPGDVSVGSHTKVWWKCKKGMNGKQALTRELAKCVIAHIAVPIHEC